VPLDVLGEHRALLQHLVHVILPEVPLARVVALLQGRGRLGLAHRHEPRVGPLVLAALAGGLRGDLDACADGGQVVGDADVG
jgi:hypothetical protein